MATLSWPDVLVHAVLPMPKLDRHINVAYRSKEVTQRQYIHFPVLINWGNTTEFRIATLGESLR